jgi:RHS repeat-associated protein
VGARSGASGDKDSRAPVGTPTGLVGSSARVASHKERSPHVTPDAERYLAGLHTPVNYNGAPFSLAGDFQEQAIKIGEEYLYDANGNLTQDKNKGITGILYNHLNLPRQIHFGQVGDSVVFHYTASGQKVAKLVYQTGRLNSQRTDYIGPYQYEQDSLKFFPHAEGRVLRFVSHDAANAPHVSYQREFIFKDHLGNLRLAYRAGQVRTLTATLEQDETTHKREIQQFDSLSVSTPIAVATPLARTGSYAARLNAGGSTPQPLGPLAQLGVQKGDTVTVSAYGYYPQATPHNFWFSLGAWLTNIVHPASAPASILEPSQSRQNLPLLQVGVAAGLPALQQLSGGVPQGYLRLLVFNKDSVLVSQHTRQLTARSYQHYDSLQMRLVVPQDGYVTAYVGSQSDVDVYFDDITVEHRQGLQVQETQYDPAGLELAGLSLPSSIIKGLNNYRFNGKEFQTDLGLNWNHQDWRFFDPQILRWHVDDPEIENGQEYWTPYSFGYNNSIRYADASGRLPDQDAGPGPGLGLGGILERLKQSIIYRIMKVIPNRSDGERNYAAQNTDDARLAYGTANQAQELANVANVDPAGRLTDGGEPGSDTNGLRHFAGSRLLRTRVNNSSAKAAEDAHEGAEVGALDDFKENANELKRTGRTQLNNVTAEIADSFVDRLNSAVGEQSLTTDSDPSVLKAFELGLNALQSGQLYQFDKPKPGQTTFIITRTSLTQTVRDEAAKRVESTLSASPLNDSYIKQPYH